MSLVLEVLSAILQLAGIFLFKYYGWVVIVAIFGYLILQNRRRIQWVEDMDHILLHLEVPRDNDKKELSAEQMFASLHGMLRSATELQRDGSVQEHFSLEIASIGNQIRFLAWVPTHLKDFFEGQIYAQYPNVRIHEGVEDYTQPELGDRTAFVTELTLAKNELLPIRTFQSFEVDPLAGITAVMGNLHQAGEEMWVQILARPADDAWHEKGYAYIDQIKNGKKKSFGQSFQDVVFELPMHILNNLARGIWQVPEATEKKKDEKKELPTGQAAAVKAIEEKVAKLGYHVKVRIAYVGPDAVLGKQRLQSIVGGFKQFNTTNLNGFTTGGVSEGADALDEYGARLFLDNGDLLNIEELASLYHLPHMSVETPNVVWATSKTSEPPSNLPTAHNTDAGNLSLIGYTDFRGKQERFGIKRDDRGRHMYVIGQTGTGKSFLLQLLMLSDLYHNQGFAIIDPHGDLATDIMKYVPEDRIKDVIYFNAADRNNPIAFNPMEVSDPTIKNNISSELIGVLKRLFDSWGPRLEYILRFTILALLDYPDSTMLGITRMLTEKGFRNKVIKEIKDPIVKNFWVNEYASWNDKFASEAVAPVLNKVGAFTANPLIRNIIGQPKSSVDLRKVMDEGKILVVNLSNGLIGEDNAGILGALMVTKMQLAAMSRANIERDQRRPFYLYVDEFQNFATDSFAVILSEARKYGLNLTVANQYVSQMPETVRDAVFGNVGSMVTFRVGAADGTVLSKYFEPGYEPADLVKLNNQHVLVNMIIDGEKSIPFAGRTLKMPATQADHTDNIIAHSRSAYASAVADVEQKIAHWTLSGGEDAPASTITPDGHLGQISPNMAPLQQPQSEASSFITALQNPNMPAAQPREQQRNPDNRGGERRNNDRSGDRNRPRHAGRR